jgi:hypothetical protein
MQMAIASVDLLSARPCGHFDSIFEQAGALLCLGDGQTSADAALSSDLKATDIEASSREALASVNPGPIFKPYGENVWAAVRAHLDAVTDHAAAPVIAKYTGVLGGADIEIFIRTTTFAIMQSIRLDRGPSGPVHP